MLTPEQLIEHSFEVLLSGNKTNVAYSDPTVLYHVFTLHKYFHDDRLRLDADGVRERIVGVARIHISAELERLGVNPEELNLVNIRNPTSCVGAWVRANLVCECEDPDTFMFELAFAHLCNLLVML